MMVGMKSMMNLFSREEINRIGVIQNTVMLEKILRQFLFEFSLKANSEQTPEIDGVPPPKY